MKTKKDIQELMNRIFKELQETREAGQKEYAHDSENAFRNFESLSTELKISREQVLWVYVKKHLDGIVSWINGHKSQREDVRGRIKDVMVYLVLLWGMADDSDNQIIPGKIYASELTEKIRFSPEEIEAPLRYARGISELDNGIDFESFDHATQIINAAGYIVMRRKI